MQLPSAKAAGRESPLAGKVKTTSEDALHGLSFERPVVHASAALLLPVALSGCESLVDRYGVRFWASVAVALFFFVVAVFFSQIDYINLFVTIMCSVWLGGGGTVMIFGLYSRFGNTAGAWSSIAFGSGFSLFGLFMQRNWADVVVPWLSRNGWTEGVFRFFAKLSEPLNPWVDWSWGLNSGESTFEQALQLFREKFFMNSPEIYGLSMILSVIAYCTGSWVARRFFGVPLFNLDKLLHRGEYADDTERERLAKAKAKKVTILGRIVGIDGEYTLGGEELTLSPAGDSMIGYADYALRMDAGVLSRP